MKFADFIEGMVADTTTFSVHEQSIIDFARQHDPQWFHLDVQAADEGPYAGLIASGWQTACLACWLAAFLPSVCSGWPQAACLATC